MWFCKPSLSGILNTQKTRANFLECCHNVCVLAKSHLHANGKINKYILDKFTPQFSTEDYRYMANILLYVRQYRRTCRTVWNGQFALDATNGDNMTRSLSEHIWKQCCKNKHNSSRTLSSAETAVRQWLQIPLCWMLAEDLVITIERIEYDLI